MESPQQPQGLPSDSIPSPPACNLCGRLVESTSPDDLEIFSLCGDCKFLLLEDFGTPAPRQTSAAATRRRRMRRRNRRRSRHHDSSSESVGEQQFTHLITIARQRSSLSTTVVHSDDQRASSHTTPSGSTRWRVFSESESEDFESFGVDSESNASFSLYRFSHGGDNNVNNDAVSFSAYGGDSDASTDRHAAFLDADIFVQPDDRSDIDFDTDIDPMHAGLNQWNSDEEDSPSGVGGTRYRNYLASPSESYSSMTRFDSPELERGFRQRIIERRQSLSRNIFTGLEDMEFSPYSINVGDFLDERGFEELLEQLAESDNSRRGAPPASVSCVRNLPKVFIGDEHVKKSLGCAICKEIYTLCNETTQLPCLHLYHAHCIIPWLSARNTCPLCRYELPTDDKDYEERKQNVVDVSEDSSSSSDDDDDDGTEVGEDEYVVRSESEAGHVSRFSRGRWLFLAAAPVVSLVGAVLAMWLSNPHRRDIAISHSQRENRSRRWLPFF